MTAEAAEARPAPVWDDDQRKPRLLAVFASKVGENGIEPDVWYELKGGKPVAVAS